MTAPRVVLLNTTILTGAGYYALEQITEEDVRGHVREAQQNGGTVLSAIGHVETAQIVSDLIGYPVGVNRIAYGQLRDDIALCFKLRGRPPEGVVLTGEQVQSIGFDWFRLRLLTPMELTKPQFVLRLIADLWHGIRPGAEEYDAHRADLLFAAEAVCGATPDINLAVLEQELVAAGLTDEEVDLFVGHIRWVDVDDDREAGA